MQKKLLWVIVLSSVIAIIALFKVISMPHNNTSQELTIGFAGDTMLGRTVSDFLMTLPPEERYRYPWGNVLPLLNKNDLNIVNLETTLTTSTRMRPKVFNFKADPSLASTLKAAHIDIVNTANNHILDFDNEGLIETLSMLDNAGINHVGSGINTDHAHKPLILTKNSVTLGIIGYTDNEPDWEAEDQTPGTNYLHVTDLEKVKRDISALREQVDVVIISIHWGPNHRERPTQPYIDCAHAMIDAGADIIHGHSAHLVQGIELYKQKLIMYDTGDFVDDYAVYEDARNDLSFLFNVTLDRQGPTKVHLIPTAISNYQVNLATGSDKEFIIRHMQQLCAELGTHLDNDGTILIG